MEVIDESHKEFVGSLAKGLSVLSTFGRNAPDLTLSRVAEAADMTRSAARRHLLTLQALGYVSTDGRKFSLTPKVLELGFSFLSSRGWLFVANPVIEGLRDEVGESAAASVLDGSDIVYVSRYVVDRVLTVGATVGTRRPAYAMAMGRVLLAQLPDDQVRERLLASTPRPLTARTVYDVGALMEEILRVREQGYSVIDQELEIGLVAVSVPLRNASGSTIAAIGVCSHASYLNAEELAARALEPAKAAAAKIANLLV